MIRLSNGIKNLILLVVSLLVIFWDPTDDGNTSNIGVTKPHDSVVMEGRHGSTTVTTTAAAGALRGFDNRRTLLASTNGNGNGNDNSMNPNGFRRQPFCDESMLSDAVSCEMRTKGGSKGERQTTGCFPRVFLPFLTPSPCLPWHIVPTASSIRHITVLQHVHRVRTDSVR